MRITSKKELSTDLIQGMLVTIGINILSLKSLIKTQEFKYSEL